MNIPDEAIEAAAGMLAQMHRDTGNWQHYEFEARAALEAASPYMHPEVTAEALRAAWDRGYATAVDGVKDIPALAWDEGRKHGATYPYGERGLATDDNPYRSHP